MGQHIEKKNVITMIILYNITYVVLPKNILECRKKLYSSKYWKSILVTDKICQPCIFAIVEVQSICIFLAFIDMCKNIPKFVNLGNKKDAVSNYGNNIIDVFINFGNNNIDVSINFGNNNIYVSIILETIISVFPLI